METPAFDWSMVVDKIAHVGAGMPSLSIGEIPLGEPDVEHQISTPESEWAIKFFKAFHAPMIQSASVDLTHCRILEIGAGFGQLAYGSLKTIEPDLYVATDVYPQLVSTLAENLPKWTSRPAGAAFLDPQGLLLFKPGAFNVIQSHSVLHHILDYRTAVRSLFERLATPGVMIFCEPCLESYLFFLTVVRLFRKTVRFSGALAEQVDAVEKYIGDRAGPMRHSVEFLRSFGAGDKYLFSAYDLMSLAEFVGADLYVQKDSRPLKENLKFELSIRGADEVTIAKFDEFLTELLPAGIDNAYFSDLRQVFCLKKR